MCKHQPPKLRRVVLLLSVFLHLQGCMATNPYPSTWPSLESEVLVGECPTIAGTYQNEGVTYPPEVPSVPLTSFFPYLLVSGESEADEVEISQDPNTVEVTLRTGERVVRVAAYHKNAPIVCPYSLDEGRRLFTFAPRGGLGDEIGYAGPPFFPVPVFYGSGTYTWFRRAVDGSLVIETKSGWGALVLVVPVGSTSSVWYRYPPSPRRD